MLWQKFAATSCCVYFVSNTVRIAYASHKWRDTPARWIQNTRSHALSILMFSVKFDTICGYAYGELHWCLRVCAFDKTEREDSWVFCTSGWLAVLCLLALEWMLWMSDRDNARPRLRTTFYRLAGSIWGHRFAPLAATLSSLPNV